MIPKFRGKTIKGLWVKGYVSVVTDKKAGAEPGIYISNSIGVPFAYEVMSETVGQSTGLKDKNGVEIFEGDIVQHSDDPKDISIIRFGEFGVPNLDEQCYQDTAIGFYFENASDLKNVEPFNMTIPLNSRYVQGVKVIGNIYENLELLEVGK